MAGSSTFWLGLIAVALLAGCGNGPTAPTSTAYAGGFTLAPREARSIQIPSAYRNIRLCNDSGSAGPLDATIGDRSPIILQPGECAQDSGDRIALSNPSAGAVSGIFRPAGGGGGRG